MIGFGPCTLCLRMTFPNGVGRDTQRRALGCTSWPTLRFGELGLIYLVQQFGIQQFRFHDLFTVAVGTHLGRAFIAADVLEISKEEMLADLSFAFAAVDAVFGPHEQAVFF